MVELALGRPAVLRECLDAVSSRSGAVCLGIRANLGFRPPQDGSTGLTVVASAVRRSCAVDSLPSSGWSQPDLDSSWHSDSPQGHEMPFLGL
jgi:hypothetical protein